MLLLTITFERKDGAFTICKKWFVKDEHHAAWYMKTKPGIHTDFYILSYNLVKRGAIQ